MCICARKKKTDIMDGMALEVIHDEERPTQRPVVLLILIMVTLIVHATLTLAF
ncbi:hypothetical protein K439DRAFT_1633861, partial [Ramaria rubella]